MMFATWFTQVRYCSEHFDERTGMGYHQAPPAERVVVYVRDAGQAKPHLEHNPLSLQRHFGVLTKFAHVESQLSGRKRQREAVCYAPVYHCDRRPCSTSVAVGLSLLGTCYTTPGRKLNDPVVEEDNGWAVLATTVPTEACGDTEILQAYQEQNTTVAPGF